MTLNFHIFYGKQKNCKKYEPLYFKQPYKTGDNPKPLKSLLFPNFSKYHKWCFKNENRLDYSTENVYIMRIKDYNKLKKENKKLPVIIDETKEINTQLAQQYTLTYN